MNRTNSVSTSMKESGRKSMKGMAFAISVIVYLACLAYAGVRSYSLFVATIDPSLLTLAVIGILALELTGLALPITLHFWAAPGMQRSVAYGFYGLDLSLIIFNAILDAAHHSGSIMPEFMSAYGTYAVPALPILCMIGWALIWITDPVSRQHDMEASVQAATHETLLMHIQQAVNDVDINDDVRRVAGEAARAIVGETLGQAQRRKLGGGSASNFQPMPTQAPAQEQYSFAAEAPTVPAQQAMLDIESRNADDIKTGQFPAVRRGNRGVNGPKG